MILKRDKQARQPFPLQGLYVITKDSADNRSSLVAEVEAAVLGGAAVIQYRAKEGRRSDVEALALRAVCRRYSVPLIINDDVDLALRIEADGVHLGREDGDLALAREQLGPDAIIGVSCYDDVERARAAEREGANYVAFGRFFPSQTKPHAPCARLQTLQNAKADLQLPIVAIGGITLDNGSILLRSGADLLAVIEGVFGNESPESEARRFRALWE